MDPGLAIFDSPLGANHNPPSHFDTMEGSLFSSMEKGMTRSGTMSSESAFAEAPSGEEHQGQGAEAAPSGGCEDAPQDGHEMDEGAFSMSAGRCLNDSNAVLAPWADVSTAALDEQEGHDRHPDAGSNAMGVPHVSQDSAEDSIAGCGMVCVADIFSVRMCGCIGMPMIPRICHGVSKAGAGSENVLGFHCG